ncbi:hypothetical protein T484DRAFT_1889208, partial [Baffinella frigidus]
MAFVRRRSGPDRPPGVCVVVPLDIASCSTDEQLPATAPAQLLQRGVCWVLAPLLFPIVLVLRQENRYYRGLGEWVAGLNSELAHKGASVGSRQAKGVSVFYRYDPGNDDDAA